MNVPKTINKIDRINVLVEKLENAREGYEEALLDWIYSERKQVLDYHNVGYYADQFQERDCDYHTLSLKVGNDHVSITSRAHYGDRDREYLLIPLKHLFEPELVTAILAEIKARKVAQDAAAAIVQEANEKKLLADLKAKYESKP